MEKKEKKLEIKKINFIINKKITSLINNSDKVKELREKDKEKIKKLFTKKPYKIEKL